jgi:hypothetical protein
MKTFIVTYWLHGDKKVAKVEGRSKYNAKVRFFLDHHADDIISIVEVTE